MSFEIINGAALWPVASLPLFVVRVHNWMHRRHGHDFEEMVLVVEGQATQFVYAPGSDEARVIPISAGDVFYVPRGWSHAYRAESQFEIYNILFDASVLAMWEASGPFFKALTGRGDLAGCPLVSKLSLRNGEREALEVLLRSVVRELTLKQGSFEIAAQIKLAEAVVLLERISNAAQVNEPHAFLVNQTIVNQAISFMEERLRDPISLRDIARAVHLSPSYFCEVFTQSIGQPPGRFLLRLRLDHARFLLVTTTRPVTEIAHLCGFADASYFARAFKSHFGSTPSRLRAIGR